MAPLQVQVISFEVVPITIQQRSPLAFEQLDLQLIYYRQGNLILNSKDILEVAIVSLRPQMIAVFNADKLSCDPQTIAGLSNASFKNVGHVELASYFAHVHLFAFERERRSARDDV